MPAEVFKNSNLYNMCTFEWLLNYALFLPNHHKFVCSVKMIVDKNIDRGALI